jgi:hypothetical protein
MKVREARCRDPFEQLCFRTLTRLLALPRRVRRTISPWNDRRKIFEGQRSGVKCGSAASRSELSSNGYGWLRTEMRSYASRRRRQNSRIDIPLRAASLIVRCQYRAFSASAFPLLIPHLRIESPRAHCTCRLADQMSGNYQAETSTAEGGFTGRIRKMREKIVTRYNRYLDAVS